MTKDKWTKKDIAQASAGLVATGSLATIAATSLFAPITVPTLLGFFGSIYVFKTVFK